MNPNDAVGASNLLTIAYSAIARTFPILAPPNCIQMARTYKGIRLMNNLFQMAMRGLRRNFLMAEFTLVIFLCASIPATAAASTTVPDTPIGKIGSALIRHVKCCRHRYAGDLSGRF